jgi:outer membrane protein assembly factor BamB
MNRTMAWIVAFIVFFVGLQRVGYSDTRELYPNTPDEVIVKRAAQQAPPLWQILLGPALIEDMQLLDPGKLLVSLRKDFPGLPNLDIMLVETSGGKILWRYTRDKLKGQYDCLLALQDLLLFRVDHGKTVSLLALDPQTGGEKWTVSLKGSQVMFLPFMAGGSALAINPGASSVELTALDLENGASVWQTSVPATKGAEHPGPQTVDDDVLVFYRGVERLSAKDGKTIFSRPELVLDANCPPPQVDHGTLWVVSAGGVLSALDVESGKVRWTATLPGGTMYTNIYPLEDKLYLRGAEVGGDFVVSSLSPADGRALWTFRAREASVSNFIETGGSLYLATATKLTALNASDGKELFSVPVTTTGRAFPIRLQLVGDRIVYIGELVVAAFDLKTGRLLYKQGMSPANAELHLNGLDAAAPNLKQELAQAALNPAGDELSKLSTFAMKETARYQSLAQSYGYQASSAMSRGDSVGSSVAGMKQRFARHEAKLQAMTAAVFSIVNLGLVLRQFFMARPIKTAIERQELFRKSILASYAQAETPEYVYRPNLLFRDAMDNFSTVAVVDVATGKRSETLLSPQYLSYGLWQVIDFEKGVVYHSNIGLDPSRYQLSEARGYYPYSKAKTVNTFLIAQPVKIPH